MQKRHHRTVSTFLDRLKQAAKMRHVHFGQSAIGQSLGYAKQTVDQWFKGNTPTADKIFVIADKWNVNPRWLATGEGTPAIDAPTAKADLAPEEQDLLIRYRASDPRWQLSLRLLSTIATEDQSEIATDVNVIIARVFGKKPHELRYPSDKKVAAFKGDAPHVAARKAKAR